MLYSLSLPWYNSQGLAQVCLTKSSLHSNLLINWHHAGSSLKSECTRKIWLHYKLKRIEYPWNDILDEGNIVFQWGSLPALAITGDSETLTDVSRFSIGVAVCVTVTVNVNHLRL